MALTRVAVDYIREHRRESSDASIRAALSGQGFSGEVLDRAFAQAGPRHSGGLPPPSAHPAVPAPPAKRRIWPWVLGSVAGAFALAVGGLYALGAWYSSHEGEEVPAAKRELPPAGAEYRPARFAEPANLPTFLPEGLLDEDAGPDYMRMLFTKGGFAEGDPDLPPPPPTKEQIALLDRALLKRNSNFGIQAFRSGLDGYSIAVNARLRILYSLSVHLAKRYKAAAESGDWERADMEARRFVLLGWHYGQDWNVAVRGMGLSTVLGGMSYCTAAAQKLDKRDAAHILASQRLPLDLLSYSSDRKITEEIHQYAADPAKFAVLMPRISDPTERRAYAEWTLFNVATTWSAEEKASGHPAPARQAFFRHAAASRDPIVREMALGFEAVMRDLETELTGAPPEKRTEVLEEINKRKGPKGPSSF